MHRGWQPCWKRFDNVLIKSLVMGWKRKDEEEGKKTNVRVVAFEWRVNHRLVVESFTLRKGVSRLEEFINPA